MCDCFLSITVNEGIDSVVGKARSAFRIGRTTGIASCVGGRENSVALSAPCAAKNVPVKDSENCDVLCYLKLLRLVHWRSFSL